VGYRVDVKNLANLHLGKSKSKFPNTSLDQKIKADNSGHNSRLKYKVDKGLELLKTTIFSSARNIPQIHESAFLWWGDQEIAEHESSAGQTVIQNDLWAHPTALNQIIARAVEGDKNKIEWYHKNYLDHVYAVSDDPPRRRNIDEHYRYTAFGEVEVYSPTGAKLNGSAIGNSVMWNSRRYDETTGLHYYKYRHYNPSTSRWQQRDTIEEQGGINLYDFVGNRPLNY